MISFGVQFFPDFNTSDLPSLNYFLRNPRKRKKDHWHQQEQITPPIDVSSHGGYYGEVFHEKVTQARFLLDCISSKVSWFLGHMFSIEMLCALMKFEGVTDSVVRDFTLRRRKIVFIPQSNCI